MAKIHGLVYILVGAFVSIMSWRLNQEKLLFFYYAGYFFIFVGVVKLLFNWIKNNAEKPKVSAQQESHHAVHKPSHTSTAHQIKYCHNCRTPLRLHNKFCSNCGARV
ncbi:zinc ribbon domain-containing protein [Candidatus Woesearchaeota archaeon]|nr:zinc ribbon domain-containing protein [Candidatus Woesearchaeota archaeon]